jgi:hypothetical protein
MTCFDGWFYEDYEITGECPDCGMPTRLDRAREGCYWSPVECKTCEYSPCDGSC